MLIFDEDISTIYTSTPTPTPSPRPLGPLTRARARQLNHQVSSFLNSCPSYLDNRDTCTLVLLRNDGKDQKHRGLAQAKFKLQNCPNLGWPPRLHTVTHFDVQIHGGKLMKFIFTWVQSHVHIHNEAAAIVDLLERPFCGQLHSIRSSMHACSGCYCFLLFLASRGISTAHSGCSLLYIKASTAIVTNRILFNRVSHLLPHFSARVG